jgi:predicted RNase H-like nuclease (RuvC/YqgF family)
MMEEWGEVVFERKDILDETTIKQMEKMLERKLPDEWDDTQKKLSLAWGGNNIMLMLSQSYLDEIKRLEKKQKLADEYIKLLEQKNEKLKKDIENSTKAIQECVKGWGQLGMLYEELKEENKKLKEELAECDRILVEKDIDAAESEDEEPNKCDKCGWESYKYSTELCATLGDGYYCPECVENAEEEVQVGKYESLIYHFEIVKKTPKRIQIKMGDATFLRGFKEDGKGKYILLPDWNSRPVKVYWTDVKYLGNN